MRANCGLSMSSIAAPDIKLEPWRGLSAYRPFPAAPWLEGMYLAHDLPAISRVRPKRKVAQMSEIRA
jgi:hypothetical protein